MVEAKTVSSGFLARDLLNLWGFFLLLFCLNPCKFKNLSPLFRLVVILTSWIRGHCLYPAHKTLTLRKHQVCSQTSQEYFVSITDVIKTNETRPQCDDVSDETNKNKARKGKLEIKTL